MSLQPIIASDESTNAFESVSPDMFNFKSLVNLRFEHQRIQAKTGVRKHTRNPEPADSRLSSQSPDTTKQKELARQLSSILKEHRERGVSTGAGRTLRWQPGRKPATHSEGVMQPPELTGNALNAAEVANAQAKKVSNLRSPPSLQVMTNFILATYTTHMSYEEIQAACRAREHPCFRIDTSPGWRSFWTRPYFIRERGNASGWTRQVIIF
jgi:hypothetical protein